MRTARAEGLDRLRAPSTLSSRHRALLMDEIQKRDFVHLSRLESTLVVVMLAVLLLDRNSGDVELFIALICTLIVEIRRKREGLCGTRYVPFPKRIRFMVVNTVDDAEAVFPQFNFHKHFLFRSKTTFM